MTYTIADRIRTITTELAKSDLTERDRWYYHGKVDAFLDCQKLIDESNSDKEKLIQFIKDISKELLKHRELFTAETVYLMNKIIS